MYTFHYEAFLGGITVAGNGKQLTGLWFDGQKHFGSTLKEPCEKQDLPVFEQTKHWLDIYFSGKEPDFTPPIFLDTTPFRKEVCELMLSIPYGKTITYEEIAIRIAQKRGIEKMSAQAVGGAVGHNPVSLIVPCHRVVGKNGSLTGYAGTVDRKYQLLKLENADMSSLFIPKRK